MLYRLFRPSRRISARASARVLFMSVVSLVPCVADSARVRWSAAARRVAASRLQRAAAGVPGTAVVVCGGDGDERLLQAEAGHLELPRPVARVQQRVQRPV